MFSLEILNVFQLTKHNKDGSQELASGYELYIQQLVNENKFLKEQNQQLLDKVTGK